jgi:hypothetical protein
VPILDPTGGAGNLGPRGSFTPGADFARGLEGLAFATQFEGTGFTGMGLPLSGYTGPPVILPAVRRPPVSILGDIFRAPASAPGTSTSLLGDIFQSGAQSLLNYAGSRTQARGAREQRKLLKLQLRAAGYIPSGPTGGGGVSILNGNVTPSMVPQQSSQAPYVEPAYTNASYYGPQVTYASGVTDLVPLAAGAVSAVASSGVVRAAIGWLVRNGLTAAAAGTAVMGLVQSGIIGGADGPYANPKHNKCTGIMRGDVMAIRRVKRQGKRLLKVLRQAGVGGRRSAGRFRRRRAC